MGCNKRPSFPGAVTVDDETYNLNVFLAADYKFLLLVLGMGGATSDHACIYCKIHKSDRWDMSKVFNFYESDPGMVRTRADMQSYYFSGTMNCKHLPLVKIM